MSEGFGPLDLSDADTSGFEAIDAGRYAAEVVEAKWDAVKNTRGDGRMPAGTPMAKFHYKIDDERYPHYNNRRVFQTLVFPPADYDKGKAEKMKGMWVRALVAFGYQEDQVKSKKFSLDLKDIEGRRCVVTVGKEPKKDQAGNIVPDEFNNPVKGVKHIDTLMGSGVGTGGGLL